MSDDDTKARQEEARARAEWAKTTGKAVEAFVDVKALVKVKYEEAVKFVARVLGPAVENLGAMATDTTAYWRFANLVKLSKKVEAIQVERGIDPALTVPVPMRLGVPLLYRASEEDDESLQMLWAGLIVSATDPARRQSVRKIYLEILNSFEPLDAQILEWLFARTFTFQNVLGGGATLDKLASALSLLKPEVSPSLANLFRLGCIVEVRAETYNSIGTSISGMQPDDPKAAFRVSRLGVELLRACGGN